jgi:hypothetical protein
MVGSYRECFVKELEKKKVQHKVDERNRRYKLEIYHKTFPKFVFGSLINTKTSSQDEEAETRLNGTA